jgi:tetratricopeptide (TPR) repeat protein
MGLYKALYNSTLLVIGLGFWPEQIAAQDMSIARDCSAYSYESTLPAVSGAYRARYKTIAHTFLDLERDVGPVTASEYALLDTIIDRAKEHLKPIPEKLSESALRKFAVESMKAIDCLLVSHGFVYPGKGLVQLLSDGLDPITYSNAADFQELLLNSHNAGRASFIQRRKPGPYYVVDCDTASYIYLAVGEILNYPLAMVALPRHNFVRWLLPQGAYIDFETMDGKETSDEYYRVRWAIPDKFLGTPGVLTTMSRSQLIAYEHFGLGIAYSWKSNLHQAIAEYKKSISVDSTLGDAANNLAWLYSVAPDRNFRDGQQAVFYARQAVEIFPSGDRLDTLACAFGVVGRFSEGVATEKRAIKAGWAPYGSDLVGNLALLESERTCEDSGFGVDPRPFRPTSLFSEAVPK